MSGPSNKFIVIIALISIVAGTLALIHDHIEYGFFSSDIHRNRTSPVAYFTFGLCCFLMADINNLKKKLRIDQDEGEKEDD